MARSKQTLKKTDPAKSQQKSLSDPSLKKKRKDRKAIERSIKKFKRSKDRLIPRAPLDRLTREIGQEYKTDLRWTKGAITALQLISESFMVDLFERADTNRQLGTLGTRMTLYPRDIMSVLSQDKGMRRTYEESIKNMMKREMIKKHGNIKKAESRTKNSEKETKKLQKLRADKEKQEKKLAMLREEYRELGGSDEEDNEEEQEETNEDHQDESETNMEEEEREDEEEQEEEELSKKKVVNTPSKKKKAESFELFTQSQTVGEE